MDFSLATYGLALLAGIISPLSPCVLPLLPIILATASANHRLGPFALAAGLALSFALIGLLLATLGSAFDVDAAMLREAGGVVMVCLGLLLFSAPLQARLSSAGAGIGRLGDSVLARFKPQGLRGQFTIGLLLGVIWTPCIGPILGAASTLATQGRDLPQVTLLMAIFGLGAGLPLVLLGSLSRGTVQRWRGRLMIAGKGGKYLMGLFLLLMGLSIVSGWDRTFEAWLLDISPDWLIAFTSRY